MFNKILKEATSGIHVIFLYIHIYLYVYICVYLPQTYIIYIYIYIYRLDFLILCKLRILNTVHDKL